MQKILYIFLLTLTSACKLLFGFGPVEIATLQIDILHVLHPRNNRSLILQQETDSALDRLRGSSMLVASHPLVTHVL
jgi:hypothetical protein